MKLEFQNGGDDMLAFMGMPGGYELVIIGIIAVLLFGHRLPSVARSLGQSIMEFKGSMRELTGFKDDMDREQREIEREIKRQ